MNNKLPLDPDPQPDRSLVSRTDSISERLPSSLDSEDGALQRHSAPLSSYLHALRRRWFVALSLGLICAAGAAVAVWVWNNDRYTAMMQFRVAAFQESLVFDDFRTAGRDNYEIYKNSQQQYIKSDYVLIAALRDDNVRKLPIVQRQDDPVRWLAKNVEVAFPGNGEVMIISLTTNDPTAAGLLVAAVSKAYLDEVVNQELKRQRDRSSDLQTQLIENKSLLDGKLTELQKLIKDLGPVDSQTLSNEQRLAQDLWTAVRRELILAQNDVTRLQAALELKKGAHQRAMEASGEAAVSLVTELDLESELARDPLFNDLKLRERDAQERMADVRKLGTPNRQAQIAQQHTEDLKKIEQQMSDRRQEVVAELRRRAMIYLNAEVAQLENELATQSKLVQRYADDEAKYRKDVREFGGSSLAVEGLQRDIDSLENVVIKPMEKQVRELKVELGRPSRVTRITRVKSDTPDLWTPDEKLTVRELADAVQPRSPDPNSQISKSTAAGFAALGLVVGGILYIEVRGKRVNSSLDVSQILGLQVIGAIPLIPTAAITRAGGNSARYRRWRTLLNESMRGVMVRLLHEARAGQSQVVMVSSASAGEGKSTLATNLAVAMARAGYRTLLVDFDLRRPTLGDLFDLPPAPGVSEVLRNEAELDDSINIVHTDNLSVLTAGHWSPYHVSVLANGDTELFFGELRERYQFIIVDGSPILGVAEAQLLCRHADTVLLSILRDVSSGPKILAACETLSAFGVRSLYAVVTGTANSDYAYYYGGYAYQREEEEE
jgi:succinoglycan biosynthesis transport protein ExoP